MKKTDFLKELEKSMELPPNVLKPESFLDEFSWDSLSIIVFITLVDKKFGISITPPQIAQCNTVNDLIGLLGNNITND